MSLLFYGIGFLSGVGVTLGAVVLLGIRHAREEARQRQEMMREAMKQFGNLSPEEFAKRVKIHVVRPPPPQVEVKEDAKDEDLGVPR